MKKILESMKKYIVDFFIKKLIHIWEIMLSNSRSMFQNRTNMGQTFYFLAFLDSHFRCVCFGFFQ